MIGFPNYVSHAAECIACSISVVCRMEQYAAIGL